MFIFHMENLKIEHIQRSINPACYRQQLVSLQERIKYVLIFKLVYNYLLGKDVMFLIALVCQFVSNIIEKKNMNR